MRAFSASIVAAFMVTAPACAQEHYHGSEVIPGVVGRFYETWMRPDSPSISCCSRMDCDAVEEVRNVGGQWRAKRRKDGIWLSIPPQKIETNRDSPDGRAHMCSLGTQVFCFIVGSGT